MENILYDCRWIDDLDEKFIADYLYVQNEVFHCGTREEFKRQFEDNIYGRSVLVVVYIDGKPVAARGLWRNDICGKESYQPGSTCVHEACRSKGIFKEMTKRATDMLPTDAMIYNFPNSNSYPGYIKMGWNLLHDYNVKLLTSYNEFKLEHPIMMDDDYANWWVKGKNLTYAKRFGHYFLLQKDHRPLCYRILAEASKGIAMGFPKASLGLYFFKSEKTTWYNKRFALGHVVCKNTEIGYIPTWKIDAI